MLNRRSFIQTSAVTTGSLLIPTYLKKKRKDKVGVALVGLGYYSRDLLAPALQMTEHCYLAGIVTGTPEKIPVWQEKYSIKDANVYNYGNMHEIANNPDIDVIYIVLPTGMHAEYAIKAAETGKHVWCEKPMARTAAECQSIIDACTKNKVQLTIGYRMHHEANTQTIMEWGRQKPYGKITELMVEAGYREGRTDHWKQNKAMGGGAMYDMGVYPLNAARYATQEEPIAITAKQYTDRPEIYHEVDETTEFILEFPSGLIANCKTSFGQSMNFLDVVCAKGHYRLEPFSSYTGVGGKADDGTTLKASPLNQQATQMDDNALAILGEKAILVPGEEGLRDIRIVEAAYASAATGERIKL